MFERVLFSVLTRFLGEYVEDSTFSAESLKLGIWRGEKRALLLLLLNKSSAVYQVYRKARYVLVLRNIPFGVRNAAQTGRQDKEIPA